MTDTEALEEMMIRSNASVSFISEKIGITNKAFSMKMQNISEFLASEIVCVKQILNLSNLERDRIFFMLKVELKSTNIKHKNLKTTFK